MRLTLCGSTRFESIFNEWNAKLTLAGHTVYSLGLFGREQSDVGKPDQNMLVTEEQKRNLDMLHFAKIDNSDGIVVLNSCGYTGISTKREIRWARMKGKRIFWLEKPDFMRLPEVVASTLLSMYEG